jgi:hypothetical protein
VVPIPPAPSEAPPRYALDIHFAYSGVLDNAALCPEGSGCVLQGGGGLGATLEKRWPSGFGAFGGYDAWFLDSDSVFELGVQQVLRGGVRFTMPTDIIVHPIFELSFGGMGYGDTFGIATVGLLVQAFSGVEIEMTEHFGVLVGVGMRAFTHTRFRTSRDRVERAVKGLATQTMFLQVGLTVM